MSEPTQICPRCATEYLEHVDECDWCPGVEPMSVVLSAPKLLALWHVTDTLIAESEVSPAVLEHLAKGAC